MPKAAENSVFAQPPLLGQALPNQGEREAIWQIQIAKYGHDPKGFDLVQLARSSDGLTGSETEGVFIEALYAAFDEESEPADFTIAQVLTELLTF